MKRFAFYAGLLMVTLGSGIVQAQSTHREPVFDVYGYHPQRLAPGTAEYDYVMQRTLQARTVRRLVDERQLGEALQACQQIQPLAQATREKCEIRARQTAAKPIPVELPRSVPPAQ